ncbi:MAG: right-handed parallel beta-helix repeat-containing protein [Lewinellaceae bacterium]|nr:right-handed parallel beta-helix repeat-containing protein [Lewinellaceae bacterium]
MSTSHLSQGNYLSIGQVGRMHRISHLLSMRKYVSCREPSQSHDPLSELPRVVTGDETWDFDTKLYTHLIIESGGELTLCGRLYMPKNGYIWVKRGGKLTVDGGLISFNRQEFEDCPNEFWEGITFDECEFLNLGNYCLEFSNAGGNVLNGCTLRSTLNGIYAAATMPLSSPVVVGSANPNAQRNSFTQNSCAINGIGLSRLIVQNNDFSVNGHGVSLNGQSGYFSFNNTFTGHDVSEQFTLTGPMEKFTNCNGFLSENFGMLIQGDNEGFVFNNNELDAEYGLLLLDYNASPGRIFKIQSEFGNLDTWLIICSRKMAPIFLPAIIPFPLFTFSYQTATRGSYRYYCALNDPNCSQQFNYYSF